MKRHRVACALALLLSCIVSTAAPRSLPPSPSPQLIPRTQQERDRQYRVEHRIVLTVHVADPAGNPVAGLERPDFTVLDNQSPRRLADFRGFAGRATEPAAPLLAVLDTVNDTTRQVQSFAEDLERFLRAEPATLPHPIAIGVFSASRVDVGQLTADRDALLGELRLRARNLHANGCFEAAQWAGAVTPHGVSGGQGIQGKPTQALECMNTRFVDSVTALTALAIQYAGGDSPVTVLWFGPGWPTLTNREFHADSADLRRNFFTRLVDVANSLREARMTLDALSSPEDSPNPEMPETRDAAFFPGVPDESKVRAGNLGLHALAHLTGGRIFTSPRNLARQIRSCFEDADAFYLLSFDAPPAVVFAEYHALEVRVDQPGAAVRTSTVYYAEQ